MPKHNYSLNLNQNNSLSLPNCKGSHSVRLYRLFARLIKSICIASLLCSNITNLCKTINDYGRSAMKIFFILFYSIHSTTIEQFDTKISKME